ncbi:ATP-dependent DEAD/H RNA helicase [Trypanosoma theileri]|uniref:RNA helicase n=1 Tax=Trypanosoma theileri TaxID=67003 RepID=A0A1X0NRS9_9TRYP|nr:ATP-dependent DEAD/H RNA helicase [Trypanosoma theileri]ORC86820.1 ATP-dependent DEAD/H RNA helicase [Trypanosoma theileri]
MRGGVICRSFGIYSRIARLSVGHHTAERYQIRWIHTIPPDVTPTASGAEASTQLSSSSLSATTTTAKMTAAEGTSENSTTANVNNEEPFTASRSAEQTASTSERTEQLYSDKNFPFKLYGEDTRVSVNDSNRVFSSSTPSSYTSALLAEQLLAQAAQDNVNGNNNNNIKGSSDEHAKNPQKFFEPDLPRDRATAAAAAAAAIAMGTEVKKVDYAPAAVFQPPAQQSRPNTDTGPPPLRFVAKNNSEIENEPSTEMDVKQDTIDEEENVIDDNDDNDKVNSRSIEGQDTEEVHVLVRDEMRNVIAVDRLTSFASLAEKLPFWLATNLGRVGYTTPTLVQSVAIPLFMEKRDVVGVAPTGSGKTVAFALPALAALASLPSEGHDKNNNNKKNNFQSSDETVSATLVEPFVLVLCPTRELVQQTRDVFAQLAGNVVRVKAAFGGQDREKQVEFLQRWGGCDVLVSTPGRLCDFVEVGVVGLGQVSFLIMDEADRMLELGFAPQLEFIMSNIKKYKRSRQTTMWTATWNATVGNLAARFLLPERVLIEVDREHKTNTDITQCLYPMQDASQRISAIVKLYDDGVISKRQQVLIFVNRKEDVERLAHDLSKALRAPPDLVQYLHGGLRQRRREAILHGFKEGSIRILCATDVAARGLDVPALDHVINYDLPIDTDAYVHRVGRTGRAGRSGMAHTFIVAGDPRAPRIARFIAAQTNIPLSDDVQALVSEVERHGGLDAAVRSKYKSHARVDGASWRGQQHELHDSRFVRGVGRVMTIKRPAPAR